MCEGAKWVLFSGRSFQSPLGISKRHQEGGARQAVRRMPDRWTAHKVANTDAFTCGCLERKTANSCSGLSSYCDDCLFVSGTVAYTPCGAVGAAFGVQAPCLCSC